MEFKIRQNNYVSPIAFKRGKKGYSKLRKPKDVFKNERLVSRAQGLEPWSYKSERLGAGENGFGFLVSWRACWQRHQDRRTCGYICYYRTEFLSELWLQFVLVWLD